MMRGFVTSIIFWLALPRGLIGGTVDKITASRVIIDPDDFKLDGIFSTILPEVKTLIECSSLALQNPDDAKLFCKTSEGECLISNSSYPANYDDESGGGGYRCYTTEKPLIDIAAARLACGDAPLCCPPPYQVVTGVGCIFGTFWSSKTYKGGITSCKAHWPTSSLLSSRPIYSNLIPYIKEKGLSHPWVGVAKQSDGVFYWLDGTPVQGTDWFAGEPDNDGDGLISFALWITGTPKVVDCAVSWTETSFWTGVMKTPKLSDRYCYESHHYLCHITE